MANTGNKVVLTLRKYVNGVPTNTTKPNVVGDPDYIAPYEDLVTCPFEALPPQPNPDTTMTHLITDADGNVANVVNNTTLSEGGTSTFNFTLNAPSGKYWSSVPLFVPDTAGCSASGTISGTDNTQLYVVVSFTQQADSTTATYTYSSTANVADVPVASSIDWSSGKTVYVSSSGTSPATQTIFGTVTVVGDDADFRVQAVNQYNYENNMTSTLTVNGISLVASTTPGSSSIAYSGLQTLSAGTYSYVLEAKLTLAGGLTSGAGVAIIEDL